MALAPGVVTADSAKSSIRFDPANQHYFIFFLPTPF